MYTHPRTPALHILTHIFNNIKAFNLPQNNELLENPSRLQTKPRLLTRLAENEKYVARYQTRYFFLFLTGTGPVWTLLDAWGLSVYMNNVGYVVTAKLNTNAMEWANTGDIIRK